MDQVTQATTAAAPTYAGDETLLHAGAVAASLVDPLCFDMQPSSVRIEPNLPSGWAVTILFLSHHAAGLYELAALADLPITRATRDNEIHIEAYARILGVDVRAVALVTPDQAAQLEGQTIPTESKAESVHTVADVPGPVPLGASVLAYSPAITPVEVPGGEQ